MKKKIYGIFIVLACFDYAFGCRSQHDSEREPILSHQGTEPPESEHVKLPESLTEGEEDKTILTGEDRERESGERQISGKWEFPVAVTKSGLLWGTIEQSRGGKRILAFRGIPYAKAPVGELRYKPPVPFPKWDGIKESKFNGHVCPQHMQFKPDIWIGDEDCLWLNVYSRDLIERQQRPVIVWIHGGGFVRGSAADYEPDFLLDEDIVLVIIQYRLGMFGFLSTEDENAAGNYGMLDQVAALHWVKNNIASFSGDPGQITIMGHDAGGASVHYHILSTMSRGLFHRAVSMSGSALCWWASLKRPLERARKLARLLECPHKDDDNKKMVECLKTKTMESMMNTHPNFYEWKHLEQSQEPISAWSPRVDGSDTTFSFMPEEPIDLMTKGNFQHVPWITGITSDEGAYRTSVLFKDMKGVREFEDQFEKIGPYMFGFHDGQSEAPKIMARKVMDHYWRAKELNNDNANGLANAISDASFSHPIDTASKIHAINSRAPVFVYHFGYKGVNSLVNLDSNKYPPKVGKSEISFGTANGDDLIYLFPILSGIFRPLQQDDLVFSQRMISLFVNFANNTQPYINMGEGVDPFVWEPVNASNAHHLDISNEMKMDGGLPNHERTEFWQSMPVYWNSDRENYKPATKVVSKDEL